MTISNKQPFQKIHEASQTTGLSQYLLRRMLREGNCPHIKSGETYYINIPALLRHLDVDNGKEGA